MTKQQHLNHSPQKQEFKAINFSKTAEECNGRLRTLQRLQIPTQGESGCNFLPLAQHHFTMCSKTVGRQFCTSSSSLFSITGSSLSSPARAGSQPHTGVSGSQPPRTRQDLPPERKTEAKKSVPEQVFPQHVKCH